MKKTILPFLVGFALTGTVSSRAADTSPPATPPAAASKPPQPAAGTAAPVFTLSDVDGKKQSLADFKGKPVAAFFFCGCRLCHKVARAWNEIQRSGTVDEPISIVIFHGDAEGTRIFAEETQLDPKRTVLLADLEEKATQSYQADPCPRAFVIDREGIIRYTNDEQGADSYKIPSPLIVARTVDALRRLPAPKPEAKPKTGDDAAKNPLQNP